MRNKPIDIIKEVGAPQPGELAEWKTGGRTVFSSALGYGAGPVLFLTTASVFIKPIMEATGWSTSEVLVSPLVSVLVTMMGPLVGRIVDRKGARRVIMYGLIPYIVLLLLFATLPLSRFTFYALAVAIGIFGAFAFNVPYSRAVASWFDKSAGKAFGMLGAGSAGMPLIGIPLVTLAIYQFGWHAGYLVLAAFALLISIPCALFGVKERHIRDVIVEKRLLSAKCANNVVEQPRYMSVKKVLSTPRFWIFSLHLFLIGGATTGFLANIQPLLLDSSLSVAFATTVTTIFVAGVSCSKILSGVLVDVMNRYVVTISMYTLSMVGSLMLAHIGIFPLAPVVAVLMIAAGIGAEVDMAAYFILKEYGRENFGTLFATGGIFGGIGSVIVPYIFGFIRDTSGGYAAASYLGAALFASGALAIIVFGILGRSKNRYPLPKLT